MKGPRFKNQSKLTEGNYELLKEALEFLSPKQRLLVYLRFWDNMTIQEIARYIGHSWNSTDTMIDSAINHLRMRIIQLNHAREETELLNQYNSLAA